MNNQRIANMFLTVRTFLKLKQEEVAKQMGITQQSYAPLESGKSTPKLGTIEKFCTATKIPPDQFVALMFVSYPFTNGTVEELLGRKPPPASWPT